MIGVRKHGSFDFTYMHQLVLEYGLIPRNLMASYLSRSGYNYKTRIKILSRLATACADREKQNEYYITMPDQLKYPLPMQKERAKCLWVLMDYIDKVDFHYRLEYPPCVIGMELDGRDYEIIYVARGEEKKALGLLRANHYEIVKRMQFAQLQGFLTQQERDMADNVRYIAVIEEEAQIQMLRYERIYTFATIGKDGIIEYFIPDWTKTLTEGTIENDDNPQF